MTFGAHKLVRSEPLLAALYSAEIFLYISANYVLGPKLLRWNFLQISLPSIRSAAHKPIFELFAIFDLNFATIVAQSTKK